MINRKRGANSLFKNIDEIKDQSITNVLKTPTNEDNDHEFKAEPKKQQRVTQSTPLSTRRSSSRRKSVSSKRKKSYGNTSITVLSSEKLKKRRSSLDESNISSLELFSGNDSISVKDVENADRDTSIETALNKTIDLSLNAIEEKSELPSPGLTASLMNDIVSAGLCDENNSFDKDETSKEQLSPCPSSSILNQCLSNNVSSDECEETMVKHDKTILEKYDLDNCLTETFYESTSNATKLFNDSDYTKNESALMKLELTAIESSVNKYPENTFYGLSFDVKEILNQTRGIKTLYGKIKFDSRI